MDIPTLPAAHPPETRLSGLGLGTLTCHLEHPGIQVVGHQMSTDNGQLLQNISGDNRGTLGRWRPDRRWRFHDAELVPETGVPLAVVGRASRTQREGCPGKVSLDHAGFSSTRTKHSTPSCPQAERNLPLSHHQRCR